MTKGESVRLCQARVMPERETTEREYVRAIVRGREISQRWNYSVSLSDVRSPAPQIQQARHRVKVRGWHLIYREYACIMRLGKGIYQPNVRYQLSCTCVS